MRPMTGALVALMLAAPPGAAWAEIVVEGAYARAASPTAMSGAAFMILRNTGETADRLIAAEADIARRVELHTHVMTGDGVMQMREVPDGFTIPAEGSHVLERGGDHVMLMGLTGPMENGARIPITLIFEQAGPVRIDVPVDLDR